MMTQSKEPATADGKPLSTREALRQLLDQVDFAQGGVSMVAVPIASLKRCHDALAAEQVWQPAETMPLEPEDWIEVQVTSTYRWHPYKPLSNEFKRGTRGRWQQPNEYGGWFNCNMPTGPWRASDAPAAQPPATSVKFPATQLVHWPTGPTPCCDAHASKLMVLGGFLGSHIVSSAAPPGAVCVNCVNEAKTTESAGG